MSEIEDDAASSDDSLRWVKKLSKTMLPLCAQPSQSPGRPLVWAPASQVSSFCTAKSRRRRASCREVVGRPLEPRPNPASVTCRGVTRPPRTCRHAQRTAPCWDRCGAAWHVLASTARSIILENYYRFGFCDLNGNKSRVNFDNVSFLDGVLSMYKLRIHACICYLNIFLNLQLWVFDTPHLREECGREVEDSAAEQEQER